MKTPRVRTAAIILTLWLSPAAGAEEISVRAGVSTQELFRGEEIIYQVQVSGSDSPERPDTGGILDFEVMFDSERANNSRSISIINGRRSEVVQTGYLFNFRLVAKKSGTLVIPAVPVAVDGTTYRTQPVQILVKEPQETEDYKLRISLSKESCYVGEPVVLEVVWYWDTEKRATSLTSFAVPAFTSVDFASYPVEVDPQTGGKVLRLPIQGEDTVVVQREGNLEGRRYTTLRFERVLLPRRAGIIQIPRATVVFEGVTGFEQYRDFFGRVSTREVVGKFVVPSNAAELQVRELPSQGRPDSFLGLVGEYHIETSANPLVVSVGDPITLTIRVSGSGHLEEFRLPPLQSLSNLADSFKIPTDRASGVMQDKTKVFTQTIRARNAEVAAIPSIELAYFDPSSRSYVTTRSEPIPLTVKETKVVTIQDVEGSDPAELRTEIEAWGEGIAYNYEGLDVLEHQNLGALALVSDPGRIAALAFAPIVYFALLIVARLGRLKSAKAGARVARKAMRVLAKDLGGKQDPDGRDETERVLDALKAYLAAKCGVPAGSMTFSDIEPELRKRGTREGALAELQRVFALCEAGRYGTIGMEETSSITERALAVAREIEEDLR